VKDLLAIAGECKENFGKSHRHPSKLVHDMPHLGIVAFEKISSCRYIEEKILHRKAGAIGHRYRFLFLYGTVLYFDINTSLVFGSFCF
jgi:hypothetical protein